MSMIDHVTIRVSDLAASVALYARVFELLEFSGERSDADGFHEWNDFSIAQADDEHPPTSGVHVAFTATSRAQVDGWWRELTAAGYQDDGPPGPRPQYSPIYYGAFIRDPQNNSVEAVHHDAVDRTGGLIDHLWIRVADLNAVKRFYTAVAPVLGLGVRDRGERVQLIADGGTFTFLEGPPAEHLHLAIGVDDDAIVAAFYGTGLTAGGTAHGAPGERPHYHAGYYAAYLLDPAGHNLEAVNHHRSQ
jgi:catechol 2,3-dioxygenase-like lactoylglutathione lyase family enzyme